MNSVEEFNSIKKFYDAKASEKPEMDATVPPPQIYNSVAAALNYTLCSRVVVPQEKMSVLLKRKFGAQFYCTAVLDNSQLQISVTLLYELRFMSYIYS